MRRLTAGVGLLMGLAWLLRRLRRAAPARMPEHPAEELRRKLAETRAPDPVPLVEPEQEAPLDERRREVHERGRAAIERMRGDGPVEATESE
jgi:hypothetical protein